MKYKIIFFSALIVIIASVHMWARMLRNEGNEQLTALRVLVATTVNEVSIHDRYGEEHIQTVKDRNQLESFCSALKQMQSWTPNHPRHERYFYLILKLADGNKYEFKMCLDAKPDNTVYIYGVRQKGKATTYLYRAKSLTLRQWFQDVGVIEGEDAEGSNKPGLEQSATPPSSP